MEGITYLEHPAPPVYLDSWPMEGASYLRPHVDWEVLNSKSMLNHVANVKFVDTDASDDVNTDLPESLTPMSTPMTALAWPCDNSSRLPTVKPEIVNRRKDSCEVNMTLPESAPPTINPNVSMKNWEDRVCRLLIYPGDFPQEVLKTNSHSTEKPMFLPRTMCIPMTQARADIGHAHPCKYMCTLLLRPIGTNCVPVTLLATINLVLLIFTVRPHWVQ